MQLLGCLMKNPLFLGEANTYCLTPNDFSRPLDKQIFAAIYNLFSGGAEKVTIMDIEDYFKAHPVAHKNFMDNNGIEYLQDAEDFGVVENFSYYYTTLKKYNAIKDLKKDLAKENIPVRPVKANRKPVYEEWSKERRVSPVQNEQILNLMANVIEKVNKPTFATDGTCNNDASVSITPPGNITAGTKAILNVTIINSDGSKTETARPLVMGDLNAVPSQVPHIYIMTDEYVEEIPDKENYLTSTFRVKTNESSHEVVGEISLRGRGNSTWYYDKRP